MFVISSSETNCMWVKKHKNKTYHSKTKTKLFEIITYLIQYYRTVIITWNTWSWLRAACCALLLSAISWNLSLSPSDRLYHHTEHCLLNSSISYKEFLQPIQGLINRMWDRIYKILGTSIISPVIFLKGNPVSRIKLRTVQLFTRSYWMNKQTHIQILGLKNYILLNYGVCSFIPLRYC